MAENETIEKDKQVCRNCGERLGPGRLGRRYCSDGCRVDYWNQQNREKSLAEKNAAEKKTAEERTIDSYYDAPELIAKIQAIQIENRRILTHLADEHRASRVPLRQLVSAGFKPQFFTSQAEPTKKDGKIYRFCFEYGFCDEGNGVMLIICRPREVELLYL